MLDTPTLPNDLESYWLPFTPNRDFKSRPRLLAKAEGMYYRDQEGRKVLDAISGLWCVNAGHARKPIVEAIRAQAAELDYAPSFHFAHPKVVRLAGRIAALAPKGLDNVFFCNSGSEAADTAMKIARGYFAAKGESQRFRFVSRARSYHGVNFGGMSFGGLPNNQKGFGPLLPGTDHRLPIPYDAAKDRFTKGELPGGENYADALETICAEIGGDTIAAVIVEPMTGSGGVFASPANYLTRLRAICDRHGILLIFDEVITGFGRLGHAFAAERYGVVPDMITFAKGITNGAVPMGGVVVKTALARSLRAQGALRDRFLPRLHLHRPSARRRRRHRHARSLPRRGPLRARSCARAEIPRRRARARRRAPCHRHQKHRSRRRDRARTRSRTRPASAATKRSTRFSSRKISSSASAATRSS